MNEQHGPILGSFEGVAFKEGRDKLGQGDIVILYTDGVTEAMNFARELYSEERLVEILGGGEYSNPEDLIKATISDIEKFAAGAEQSDDITLLALSFHTSPTH